MTYSYSVSFIHAIHYLLPAEGGYVNNPHDTGGQTKFGISQRSYPHLNIAALTEDDATEIYYRDFWLKAGCDKLPAGISLAVFDAAVQHGIKPAVQQLQRAVGVRDDGVIGPVTLNAVETFAPQYLFIRLLNRRALAYARIIAVNPTQKVFLDGWFNRLDKLTPAVLEVL
ncbi:MULTISPECIES: glycoside hydrolase family 108 protein [Photorhabdus]|uniref:glycoside hydrolase family 108 protein n=1 Tax=Photorhabdus TaxID=29487 RepID=UPI0007B45E7E|nr:MULTISPECIES: glycosyl hydrolase 108 family protein [Photorhabdus]AXG42217.1 peptidoglycan-binding protein [Photorhabdus laumondii subsp. laumondii]AXG42430.1 peptidoglycan-binding protein [Photorhabdus laumondii subsp. laumondii]MCC8387683.1 N-acetylmuramidase [Photorhabdus laumondii]MCZ1247939.1 peptidoglycan-binding protein [Photorhabdus laumondii subsp. laumondii]NDL15046.1 peptidoglycan-binding protein [Photorhabdus laumondii subsp. laumondii]